MPEFAPAIGAAAVRANALAIVARLLGGERLQAVAREYRATFATVCKVYAQHTTKAQRERARVQKLKANPAVRAAMFQPGHKTWNQGMYVRTSPATEFKPGELRGTAARNWCAVGTIRTVKSNGGPCRMVKVADEGPRRLRWVPVARQAWARHNGPIPAGRIIVHLDDDTLNDAPENLACITRAELVRRNAAKSPERHRRNLAKATRDRFKVYREVKAAKASRVAVAPEPVGVPCDVKSKARARLAAFLGQLQEVA